MKYLIPIFIFVMLLSSCRSGNNESTQARTPGLNEMADLNRYMVQKDRERIQSYIERKQLKMTESPTGLWYCIENEGEGELLKDFDRVVMEYQCSLLDGTECYSSLKDGPKDVILGRSEIEPGLYQGLRLLKPGGEGIFIIPPFLGFGLKGDGKNIPSRAVIVYNIHILRGEKIKN